MSDQKPPEVSYGFNTPEYIVTTVFDSILYGAGRDQTDGDSSEIRALKEEIEPSTSLKKGVLLARAILDLENPNGKLIVQTQGDDGQTLAYACLAELRGISEGQDRVVTEKSVICIILDPNFKGLKRNKKGFLFKKEESFSIKKEDGLALLNVVVGAQTLLEKEGDRVLTRNEFRRLTSS